jgi:hypothetical protein
VGAGAAGAGADAGMAPAAASSSHSPHDFEISGKIAKKIAFLFLYNLPYYLVQILKNAIFYPISGKNR